jgi:L-rhamnose mutarotase
MIRRAFTMRLKPDSLAEYKRHHDNIWPELVAEIERSGIASITTFRRDLDLLVVSEVADLGAWERLWNSQVHERWSQFMTPLMELTEGGLVEAVELEEIFHIATGTGLAVGTPLAEGASGEPVVELAAIAAGRETALAAPGPWQGEWAPGVAVAGIELTVEEVTHLAAAPAAEGSNGAPVELPRAWPPQPTLEPEQTSEASEAPAAKPARKMATGRARKSAIKQRAGKRKAPGGRKTKRKTAKYAKAKSGNGKKKTGRSTKATATVKKPPAKKKKTARKHR